MDYHILSVVALSVALGAACGFRVFVPLLITSIAAYNQWIVLAPDMSWLGSETTVI
ncbi:MAG: DUF4126 domain-containing protein, partial [Bacteroidetes bacterium]|nr:DUF4126 domain-containing protein [Bacteroidota bacterium]